MRTSAANAEIDSPIRLEYSESKTCCKMLGDTLKKASSKRLDETIRPLVCYDTAMVMMIETFYELLTTTAVSFGMYQIKDYWNTSDKISVYYSIFIFTIVVLFLLMNGLFTFYTSKNLAILHTARRNQHNKELLC